MISLLLKRLILGAFLIMLFDYVWITLNYHMYSNVTALIQKSPMQVRLLPAIMSYILLITSLFLRLKDNKVWSKEVLFYACLEGLILYGVYNATNMALLKDYTMEVAIKDTLWGSFLMGAVVSTPLLIIS